MSRFFERNEDGTYTEKIESIDVCKWKIDEICCNDKSDYLRRLFTILLQM